MRFGASAAKIAFGLFALVSGNLRAQEGRPMKAGEDWPMYGRNLRHTFSNEHSRINPSNVSSLQLAWTFATGDAVSASPTVVDRVVYVALGMATSTRLRPIRAH